MYFIFSLFKKLKIKCKCCCHNDGTTNNCDHYYCLSTYSSYDGVLQRCSNDLQVIFILNMILDEQSNI